MALTCVFNSPHCCALIMFNPTFSSLPKHRDCVAQYDSLWWFGLKEVCLFILISDWNPWVGLPSHVVVWIFSHLCCDIMDLLAPLLRSFGFSQPHLLCTKRIQFILSFFLLPCDRTLPSATRRTGRKRKVYLPKSTFALRMDWWTNEARQKWLEPQIKKWIKAA